ncbi:hypothetical protein LL251_07325 [Sphingobium naphthae]|nr:hypothetical protein [Sphingobium naphthae]
MNRRGNVRRIAGKLWRMTAAEDKAISEGFPALPKSAFRRGPDGDGIAYRIESDNEAMMLKASFPLDL